MARRYTKLSQFPEAVRKKATTRVRRRFNKKGIRPLRYFAELSLPGLPRKKKRIKKKVCVQGVYRRRSLSYEIFEQRCKKAAEEIALKEDCTNLQIYTDYCGRFFVIGERTERQEEFDARYAEALFNRAVRLAAREELKHRLDKDREWEKKREKKAQREQFKDLAKSLGKAEVSRILKRLEKAK